MISDKKAWLFSPVKDFIGILLPAFIAVIAVFFLPVVYTSSDKESLVGWVVLVLLVDVAHVYSTLYKTYFVQERLARHKVLYTLIPVGCYLLGVLLYAIDGMLFWRVLAYTAVFHFIRQQYGFVRLYTRYDARGNWWSKLDAIAIYNATVFPILYWHLSPGRNFNWFIKDDLQAIDMPLLRQVLFCVYVSILLVYIIKEIYYIAKTKIINVPKNLVMLSTYASWYLGIIYFNGDLAFTLLNVVAHGVPYMALVGYEYTANVKRNSKRWKQLFYFVGLIVVLAFIEEGLWDGFVWREHHQLFAWFYALPNVQSSLAMIFLVPLLSLPQSTHYVLDGFIWRKGH